MSLHPPLADGFGKGRRWVFQPTGRGTYYIIMQEDAWRQRGWRLCSPRSASFGDVRDEGSAYAVAQPVQPSCGDEWRLEDAGDGTVFITCAEDHCGQQAWKLACHSHYDRDRRGRDNGFYALVHKQTWAASRWRLVPCGDRLVACNGTATFASSRFRQLYPSTPAPANSQEVRTALTVFLQQRLPFTTSDTVKDFLRCAFEGCREEPGQAMARLWTWYQPLGNRELCSYINEAIRLDAAGGLVEEVVPLVRALNRVLVLPSRGLQRGAVAAAATAQQLRPNVTYRGVGMPEPHLDFFRAMPLYRTNMFLATSYEESIARRFARDRSRSSPAQRPALFRIHFDNIRGCDHGAYIEALTSVHGEHEFLLPPYSALQVTQPPRQEGGLWVIDVVAIPDNTDIAEELPLSPWH